LPLYRGYLACCIICIMSTREIPLRNNFIYHVFNKTIDNKNVFSDFDSSSELYKRLIYYRSKNSIRSYSQLKLLGKEVSVKVDKEIEILNYAFLPNHYHFLIKQLATNGISEFMSKVFNSYTRYYNLKKKRNGQVFLQSFKAIDIMSEEQLIHTSRYIDLNPYSCGLLKNINNLKDFKWSGYRAYVDDSFIDPLISTKEILNLFDKDRQRYKGFVLDRADYQKSLEYIKHQIY